VTFNTLLKGCAIKKMLYKSYDLFQTMKTHGLRPNQVTFNTLIEVYVRCGRQDHAWSLLAEMKEMHVKPDNYTLSSLVKGIKPHRDFWNQNGKYSDCTVDPRVSRVIELVDKMYKRPSDFGDKPDEILYNCLLDLCVRYKDTKTAVRIFDQMRFQGLKPSAVTYGILIKSFGIQNNLTKAF
jgi:pentatricopeptide repeat protein